MHHSSLEDLAIAVLIPCYNEEQTIGDVVSRFRVTLPAASVYVYDNDALVSLDGLQGITRLGYASSGYTPYSYSLQVFGNAEARMPLARLDRDLGKLIVALGADERGAHIPMGQ